MVGAWYTATSYRAQATYFAIMRAYVTYNPYGPWVAMKASSALWLQPAPCGGRELQRRVCLLAELYA